MELSLPTPMIRCTFLILSFDHPINYLQYTHMEKERQPTGWRSLCFQ